MIEFSILCLDRHNMQDAISQILPLVDSVHLDIMDGDFVPAKAYSPEFINSFETNLPKHVHAMCFDPDKSLEQLDEIESFTFHMEAVERPLELIEKIKRRSIMAGICINPMTPVSDIRHLLSYIDRVLVMAVNPGYSGQKYIPTTSEKIIQLHRESPNIEIVVDGGMHEDTVREVMTLGARAFVVCSVIVKSENWESKIKQLKGSAKIGHKNKIILQDINGLSQKEGYSRK